jgi:peptide/nickel transport system permease protein
MITRSYLQSILGPLRLVSSDPLALTGLVLLTAVILMALTAPHIVPYNPNEIIEEEEASLLYREEGAWRIGPMLGDVAISGVDTDGQTALAVGREGTAYRYEDGNWHTIEVSIRTDWQDVSLNPSGLALAVGSNGAVGLWNGQAWEKLPEPEVVNLNDVAWLNERQALIVGANETIWLLDWDGNQADIIPLDSPVGQGLALNAVDVDVDGQAHLVGERGLSLRYDPADNSLSLDPMPSFRDFNDIYFSPTGQALVVGERGTLIRRTEGEWVEEVSPDARALRAGWIGDDGTALAVGRNGVIVEFDGERWRRVQTNTERHFRAVTVVNGMPIALGSDAFVNKLSPPNARHWFGTDHLGRDLLSQNIYGSRIALLVGFLGAFLVVLIGTNIGLIAGYYRGRTDDILMRAVDVMYAIPFEPFALILVLLFDPSLTIVIAAISLLIWRTVARIIRSQVLSLAERPFVKAARVAGASDLRIMYLHIAPNILPLIFLQLAIIVGAAIIAEATLSFLGLGPPQSISWGGILHNARLSGAWRTAWWWNLPPGGFIMLTVMSVFFISRALEVIANPRLQKR